MFEENKWYKFVGDKEEFLSESLANTHVYNVIGNEPFKVLEADRTAVITIMAGQRKFTVDDIDPDKGLDVILCKAEFGYFKELSDHKSAGTVVVVQILDGKATPSIPLSESDANESIEAFLRNNPKGKVDVYSFSKSASMGVIYN